MEIQKKSLLIPGLSALLLLAACNSQATIENDDSSSSSSASVMMHDDESMDHDEDDMMMHSSSSQSDESMTDTDARIIAMTSTDWSFNPLTISAKKGEKVIVRLTNKDGIHSFGAMELGLNVRINPGETKDIVIPTDKAGTFEFKCLVPCGPGHRDMKGTIVIS